MTALLPGDAALARLLRRCESVAGGCLEWRGCVNSRGYGVIGVRDRRVLTHRLSYEASVGPIPEGLTIDHLCRNKLCVRPEHLEPVTIAENLRRARPVLTHCKHGHAYTPENTIVKRQPKGLTIRNCRTCANERRRVTGPDRRRRTTSVPVVGGGARTASDPPAGQEEVSAPVGASSAFPSVRPGAVTPPGPDATSVPTIRKP